MHFLLYNLNKNILEMKTDGLFSEELSITRNVSIGQMDEAKYKCLPP